jgi:hypothetical protein
MTKPRAAEAQPSEPAAGRPDLEGDVKAQRRDKKPARHTGGTRDTYLGAGCRRNVISMGSDAGWPRRDEGGGRREGAHRRYGNELNERPYASSPCTTMFCGSLLTFHLHIHRTVAGPWQATDPETDDT